MKFEDIKGKKYAIHCPTQELHDRVYEILKSKGVDYVASQGANYFRNSSFHFLVNYDNDETLYKTENIVDYKKDISTIISAEDFIKANTMEKYVECINREDNQNITIGKVYKLHDKDYSKYWYVINDNDYSGSYSLDKFRLSTLEAYNQQNKPKDTRIEVFPNIFIGDIVVSLEKKVVCREQGELLKVENKSRKHCLDYNSEKYGHADSIQPSSWRKATKEEIEFFNKGGKNINDMPNKELYLDVKSTSFDFKHEPKVGDYYKLKKANYSFDTIGDIIKIKENCGNYVISDDENSIRKDKLSFYTSQWNYSLEDIEYIRMELPKEEQKGVINPIVGKFYWAKHSSSENDYLIKLSNYKDNLGTSNKWWSFSHDKEYNSNISGFTIEKECSISEIKKYFPDEIVEEQSKSHLQQWKEYLDKNWLDIENSIWYSTTKSLEQSSIITKPKKIRKLLTIQAQNPVLISKKTSKQSLLTI